MKRFTPLAIVAIIALVTLTTVSVVLTRAGVVHASGTSHAPISILQDSDFMACSCVSSGNGTTSNPYIIGPLSIS